MPPIVTVTNRVEGSVVCRSVTDKDCKNDWVGPRKHLLHILHSFEANTVLCSFNTIQPPSSNKSFLVKEHTSKERGWEKYEVTQHHFIICNQLSKCL